MNTTDMTIRQKLSTIERLAAEVENSLPRSAVEVGRYSIFPVKTHFIGEPLDRIRKDATTVIANLPRGVA